MLHFREVCDRTVLLPRVWCYSDWLDLVLFSDVSLVYIFACDRPEIGSEFYV